MNGNNEKELKRVFSENQSYSIELDNYLEIIYFQFLKNSISEKFTKFFFIDILEFPLYICESIFYAFQENPKEYLTLNEFKDGCKLLFYNKNLFKIYDSENEYLNYEEFKRDLNKKNIFISKILLKNKYEINIKEVILFYQNLLIFSFIKHKAYAMKKKINCSIIMIKYLLKKSFHKIILKESLSKNYEEYYFDYLKKGKKEDFFFREFSDFIMYDIKFTSRILKSLLDIEIQLTNIFYFIMSLNNPFSFRSINFISKFKNKNLIYSNEEDFDNTEDSEDFSIGSIPSISTKCKTMNNSPLNRSRSNCDNDHSNSFDFNLDSNEMLKLNLINRKSKFFSKIDFGYFKDKLNEIKDKFIKNENEDYFEDNHEIHMIVNDNNENNFKEIKFFDFEIQEDNFKFVDNYQIYSPIRYSEDLKSKIEKNESFIFENKIKNPKSICDDDHSDISLTSDSDSSENNSIEAKELKENLYNKSDEKHYVYTKKKIDENIKVLNNDLFINDVGYKDKFIFKPIKNENFIKLNSIRKAFLKLRYYWEIGYKEKKINEIIIHAKILNLKDESKVEKKEINKNFEYYQNNFTNCLFQFIGNDLFLLKFNEEVTTIIKLIYIHSQIYYSFKIIKNVEDININDKYTNKLNDISNDTNNQEMNSDYKEFFQELYPNNYKFEKAGIEEKEKKVHYKKELFLIELNDKKSSFEIIFENHEDIRLFLENIERVCSKKHINEKNFSYPVTFENNFKLISNNFKKNFLEEILSYNTNGVTLSICENNGNSYSGEFMKNFYEFFSKISDEEYTIVKNKETNARVKCIIMNKSNFTLIQVYLVRQINLLAKINNFSKYFIFPLINIIETKNYIILQLSYFNDETEKNYKASKLSNHSLDVTNKNFADKLISMLNISSQIDKLSLKLDHEFYMKLYILLTNHLIVH